LDEESDWQRQVLVGLIVLVTVGAVVGGIFALITIKAADIAGIDDTTADTGSPRHDGSGPGPTESPTSPSSTSPSSPTDSTTPSSGGPSSGGSSTTTGHPPHTGIELAATPATVSTYQRINLTGTYPAPSGTVLQVQRKEGGQWVDFPTVAKVDGGKFSTYIETGHTGVNLLRVVDIGGGAASNTVRVQVS
jgi:hypothetical protein